MRSPLEASLTSIAQIFVEAISEKARVKHFGHVLDDDYAGANR